MTNQDVYEPALVALASKETPTPEGREAVRRALMRMEAIREPMDRIEREAVERIMSDPEAPQWSRETTSSVDSKKMHRVLSRFANGEAVDNNEAELAGAYLKQWRAFDLGLNTLCRELHANLRPLIERLPVAPKKPMGLSRRTAEN